MNQFKRRILDVARACRETAYAADFTMACFVHGTCGTPGCAIGNYAARRDLQSEFAIAPVSFLGFGFQRAIRFEVFQRGFDPPIHLGQFEGYFGLSYDEAFELFNGKGCGGAETPAQAAEYIEAFAERKWPEPKLPASVRAIFESEPAVPAECA